MSGHSKWSTIKRKKGAKDAKRGASFSKAARLIEVAAKGGPDPDLNFKLKLAIAKAKELNVPNNNIDKAIKKGSGQDKEASSIEEITYEGLGPANVGVIIEAVTDNKNRTVSEIRHIFSKNGGNFGTSVAWQFESLGILQIPKSNDKEALELAIIDSGAIDFEDLGDYIEVHTKPKELDKVKTSLEQVGFKVESAVLGMVPKNKTTITDKSLAKKALNFLDVLEEHEDVSEIYSNLDIPEELLSEIS